MLEWSLFFVFMKWEWNEIKRRDGMEVRAAGRQERSELTFHFISLSALSYCYNSRAAASFASPFRFILSIAQQIQYFHLSAFIPFFSLHSLFRWSAPQSLLCSLFGGAPASEPLNQSIFEKIGD